MAHELPDAFFEGLEPGPVPYVEGGRLVRADDPKRLRTSEQRDRQGDEPDPISATPYIWVEPKDVPRRQWLFRKHYIREFLSATVAAGGGSKTTLSIVDALSMVIGRDLGTGVPLESGPMRVWFMQLEDPMEEMQRRIQATCQHYGIKPEEIGDRLFVDSGRDRVIIVAQEIQGMVMAVPLDVEAIKASIRDRRIDVLIVDPYVASHQVSENDNVKQDAVARIWKDIASECHVSIEALHHIRKNNGMEVTIDDVRGAGAFVNAARSVRLLNPMSTEDAKRFGIEEGRRRFHFWVNPSGKANLAPPSVTREWYELKSVDLANGDDAHDSDHIGVASPWQPPDALSEVTGADVIALRSRLALMTEPELRASCRSASNAIGWIGGIVGELLEIDYHDTQGKAQIVAVGTLAYAYPGTCIPGAPGRDGLGPQPKSTRAYA
jgi:hypothetical protein